MPENKYQLLHLEIAKNICNQNCIYCYINLYKQKIKNYNFKKLPQILEFCQKNEIAKLLIQGGEPTVVKKVYAFLQKIVRHTKCKIGLVTNGKLFNEQWAELFANNGYEVNFSLNSTNETKYRELTPKSDFKKTLENIIRFQIKKESLKNSTCKTAISMVVCQETVDQISDFYLIGEALQVDKIKYYPDVSSKYGLTDLKPGTKEKLWQEIDKFLSLYRNNNKIDWLEFNKLLTFIAYPKKEVIFKEKISSLCSAPWDSLFIDHNLNVYVCCHSSYIMGNLNNQKIGEILASEKIKIFQDNFPVMQKEYCAQRCPKNNLPD